MTSTGHFTRLLPSDLFHNLLPNSPSLSVPMNTCRRLSFLIGSWPGLSVIVGGGEVSHKDASEIYLKNKSSKVHYFQQLERTPPPPREDTLPHLSLLTDNSAPKVFGQGAISALPVPLPEPAAACLRLPSKPCKSAALPRPPRARSTKRSPRPSSVRPPSPTRPLALGRSTPAAWKGHLLEP